MPSSWWQSNNLLLLQINTLPCTLSAGCPISWRSGLLSACLRGPGPLRWCWGTHRRVSWEGKLAHRVDLEAKAWFIPPRYLGRVSFPGEKSLVGRPELDQPLHILLSHWKQRGSKVNIQQQWQVKTSSHTNVIAYFYSCFLGTVAADSGQTPLWSWKKRGSVLLGQLGRKEGGRERRKEARRGASVLVFRPDANYIRYRILRVQQPCISYSRAPPPIVWGSPGANLT